METGYRLIDSGNGRKVEQFGPYILERPAAQAIWQPTVRWPQADASFTREEGMQWTFNRKIPQEWPVVIDGMEMSCSLTDFGHVGLFPEHGITWRYIKDKVHEPIRLLNLFAYSGAVSIAAAQAGAEVTHVDASKGMVDWAARNARNNGLSNIRWIVDDVMKFLAREIRREKTYHAIVLDPPSFGRGAQGEIFKLERDVSELLQLCADVLDPQAHFVILTSHTPSFSPLSCHHLLQQRFPRGKVEMGEMTIEGPLSLPSGTYARWHAY